jgi:hypothetical protein
MRKKREYLSFQKAEEIRDLRKSGILTHEICERFNIRSDTVRKIIRGFSHKPVIYVSVDPKLFTILTRLAHEQKCTTNKVVTDIIARELIKYI